MATKNEEIKGAEVVAMDPVKKELQAKNEECEALKAKLARMELDLLEARMKSTQNQSEVDEIHKMKEISEELLTKAKSIIFEKVKTCKNQELQIEALNAQVTSLKDVVSITKNLLEIRNLEVTHLQDQINAMNGKIECEKERQELVHKKLEKMIRMNADLKREYETQLVLFNALRDRYQERELAKNLIEEANVIIKAASDVSTEESPDSPDGPKSMAVSNCTTDTVSVVSQESTESQAESKTS
ncbi:uncharacterized protein [Atheta coriaria]|uniref:uncharacterized protein n=1 Tax=Dalotia coriaria TaxID=877792 RepID=UPI0031F3DAA1